MIYLTPKPSQIFFAYQKQCKENYFTEKRPFKGKREMEDWKENEKKAF